VMDTSGGMYYLIVVGTGSGPEGSRPHRKRMAPAGLRGGEGMCNRSWICASYRERVPIIF